MADTGAPWNLPTTDLPDQPHAPAQLADLAEGMHAALGRAYPCTSISRPAPTEGLLIFETDTDTLLISPDGTNWRVLFSAPGLGTIERNDILTAATGFTIAGQRFWKTGGMVAFIATATRSGTTISATADGNIAAINMATIATGWRPPAGTFWDVVGGGASGRLSAGYMSGSGNFAIGAMESTPGGDWPNAESRSFSGTYPCGDG